MPYINILPYITLIELESTLVHRNSQENDEQNGNKLYLYYIYKISLLLLYFIMYNNVYYIIFYC